jgi:hypothetical protein
MKAMLFVISCFSALAVADAIITDSGKTTYAPPGYVAIFVPLSQIGKLEVTDTATIIWPGLKLPPKEADCVPSDELVLGPGAVSCTD